MRTSRALTPRQRFVRRFLTKIGTCPTGACLPWLGAKDRRGYGGMRIPRELREEFGGRRWMKVHLIALVLFRGVDARTLRHGHHVCSERGEAFDAHDCANPYHVENLEPCEHARQHAARRPCRRNS